MDMSAFVAPKSDQLNADDLIAGPRTIRISRVSGTGNADQPVAVYFDGDGGKPFKPCKSMRRVMIAAWGVNAEQYVGRSMTLHRDPKVRFGGMEVGGIRISHMTDIAEPMQMALTVTKAKREMYLVRPLAVQEPEDKAAAVAHDLIDAIRNTTDRGALEAITGSERCVNLRARMAKGRPDLAEKVDKAVADRLAAFDEADAFDGGSEPA